MATEKRLIDANALLETGSGIKMIVPVNCHPYVAIRIQGNAFRKAVEEAPTVDAVEVVHGRWEDAYDGKYANPRYRCSVCKGKALYKIEIDCLGSYKDVQALTPICPYCSAKLDGGNNNDI